MGSQWGSLFNGYGIQQSESDSPNHTLNTEITVLHKGLLDIGYPMTLGGDLRLSLVPLY